MNIKVIFISLLLLCFSPFSWAKCQLKADQKVTSNKAFYRSLETLTAPKLHQALNLFSRQGQRHLPYSCLWQVLAQTDRHPVQKNAVQTIYSQKAIKIRNKDYGQDNPNSWNREHIWPKAKYFKRRVQWAFSDAHHIRAADKSINADRSSLDFATLGNKGRQHSECSQCRFNRDAWQAPANVRGDIARMLFYMAVRYDGDAQSKTPDLILSQHQSKNFQAKFGRLCELLDWHQQDPVSADERQRNDQVQRWQGNRNPFIDHPRFAQRLFAQKCKKAL